MGSFSVRPPVLDRSPNPRGSRWHERGGWTAVGASSSMVDRRSRGGVAAAGAAHTRLDGHTPRSRRVGSERAVWAALGALALYLLPPAHATHEVYSSEMDQDGYCSGLNRFMSCCPETVPIPAPGLPAPPLLSSPVVPRPRARCLSSLSSLRQAVEMIPSSCLLATRGSSDLSVLWVPPHHGTSSEIGPGGADRTGTACPTPVCQLPWRRRK